MSSTMDVIAIDGKKAGTVELPAELFDARVSEAAVHRAVVAYETNQRQGNASAKGRSEIARSGRKHHRQKGTGMARRGDVKTNLMRGGGVAFGHPKPRDYDNKLTKSMKRLAFCSALTDKARSDALRVVVDPELAAPSTRSFAQMVEACGVAGRKVLFVTPESSPVLVKSCRNLPGVQIRTAATMATYDVVAADVVVLTWKAVEALAQSRGTSGEAE